MDGRVLWVELLQLSCPFLVPLPFLNQTERDFAKGVAGTVLLPFLFSSIFFSFLPFLSMFPVSSVFFCYLPFSLSFQNKKKRGDKVRETPLAKPRNIQEGSRGLGAENPGDGADFPAAVLLAGTGPNSLPRS